MGDPSYLRTFVDETRLTGLRFNFDIGHAHLADGPEGERVEKGFAVLNYFPWCLTIGETNSQRPYLSITDLGNLLPVFTHPTTIIVMMPETVSTRLATEGKSIVSCKPYLWLKVCSFWFTVSSSIAALFPDRASIFPHRLRLRPAHLARTTNNGRGFESLGRMRCTDW